MGLTHAYSRVYKRSMTTQDLRPEVEERLRQLDSAAHQPSAQPTDKLIADYLANGPHDEWTVTTARRVLKEDAEFFTMLGDR
jgi:hypothetical protein